MKPVLVIVAAAAAVALLGSMAVSQTLAPTPVKSVKLIKPAADANDLRALAKKIDEQNAKIDALSQQILQLEQEIAKMRPGVMIGEATPPPTPTRRAPAATEQQPKPAGASEYIVGRGETLTSIARAHNISVSELQNYNHIENPLKLQAGQTILIPPSPTPAASASGE